MSGPLQVPTQLADHIVFFLVIIGLTALTTNSLIIFLLYKNPRQRRGYNFFALQNSIADLLCTVICVPFWILASLHGKAEQFSRDKAFCELSAVVSFMQLIASGIFLMQAAAYRHCSLTDQEQVAKRFTTTRSRLLVVFTWVLTALVCVCPHFAWSTRPRLICAPDLVTHSWYTAFVLCFLIAFPQSASLFVMLYDICSLRQNSTFMTERRQASASADSNRQDCASNHTALQRNEMLMVHRGLFLVILIHTLFWLPYVFISIIETLSGGKVYYLDDEQGMPVNFIALVVSLTSASVKGIVYCFENPHMRCLVMDQFHCNYTGNEDADDVERRELNNTR